MGSILVDGIVAYVAITIDRKRENFRAVTFFGCLYAIRKARFNFGSLVAADVTNPALSARQNRAR
jgi:hypothetical protein